MDGVQQAASAINDLVSSALHELTSVWLLLEFGLILVAAALGMLVATLIRRRIDITALTMGWPPLLRQFVRHVLANLGTIIFVLVVAIMHAGMEAVTWPSRSYLLGVASSLATAWVIIALVAGLIQNQFV